MTHCSTTLLRFSRSCGAFLLFSRSIQQSARAFCTVTGAAGLTAGATGAAIVAALAKLKAILLLLPKVKLLASSGTILVSLVAYAVFWGWPFAAGFDFMLPI